MAQVVADDSPGVYLFQLMTLPHRNVIAARRIAAPVGYHPHRLSLRWAGTSVIATIDHDFGEGNLEFTLSAPR